MAKLRIIIIGGLAAGPAAAATARKQDPECEIILFEKSSQINYSTCGIPYLLSGEISEKELLLDFSPEVLRKKFQVDVHLGEQVIYIDPEAHQVTTGSGVYFYDKLIFAAGANPVKPPITGLDEMQNWSYCKTFDHLDKIMADGVLTNKKDITVLGANPDGIQIAENLTKVGKQVTLIELGTHVLPGWDTKFGHLALHELTAHGIKVLTKTCISKIEKNGKLIKLCDGSELGTDYLIVAMGNRPNTDLLLAEGAEHLRNGAITVNEKMETNLPDIYAAGDCTSLKNLITGEYDYFPMSTQPNIGGRTAGANAAGGKETFKGAYGSSIVRVFGHNFAKTGLNAEGLRKLDIPFHSAALMTNGMTSYRPGSHALFVEIFYHATTGHILGAEVFGGKGVDKKIDIISTCIYAKLTIDDLPQLDLVHSPPFSPIKSPAPLSGYVNYHSPKVGFKEIECADLAYLLGSPEVKDYVILDVSETPTAIAPIKNAIHKPLEEIQLYHSNPHKGDKNNGSTENIIDNLTDKDKGIIVYCENGIESYLACLLLVNQGYTNVFKLAGGYTGYIFWEKTLGKVQPKQETLK